MLPDVHTFKGHIACSSVSKSELVIPIWYEGEIIGVLDIDGANIGDFDEQDEREIRGMLEEIDKIGHFRWFSEHI